jgi:hypothetical protein
LSDIGETVNTTSIEDGVVSFSNGEAVKFVHEFIEFAILFLSSGRFLKANRMGFHRGARSARRWRW